ncbi:MAG: sigma-54-dependent Fis family transcriptional regulator [Comamonadaceae bacterium]|nr:sigma-54-dependent Fis family transcriptional regulator [Comamonadaceae bacterium]
MAMLLIIEDEAVLARNVARFFEKLGHTVEVAHDGPAGVEAARRVMPDVAIVDFQLPGLDGLEVIGALRKIDAELRCVMVTGHASVPVAIDAMKAGYMDLLTKPVALASLKAVVDRALAERGTRRALDYYQKKEADESSLEALAGDSAPMQALRDLVRTIALSEPADRSPGAPILVLGETGAGKELVARACHYAGPRASAPFVEINCAALPAHLIEGELFGHEKGAFTDAQARKIGLIEAADGGTLFLDEIGELDLSLQAKLLRVLENFRVRRLGALQDRLVNVRVVCATNRDLDQLVEAGRFRADLLYRLRVFQINIPPLRARGDDVLLLARRFLAQMAQRYGKAPPMLDASACDALRAHTWPGNVRELRNVVERAVLLNQGQPLGAADLALGPRPAAPRAAAAAPGPAGGASLEAVERQHLIQALEQAQWNVTRAARLLDISRDTLRYRIEKHGLQRPAGQTIVD